MLAKTGGHDKRLGRRYDYLVSSALLAFSTSTASAAFSLSTESIAFL
jgi:hypothetical protein